MKRTLLFSIMMIALLRSVSLPALGTNHQPSTFAYNQPLSCTAPVPTGLHDTEVTPSSISLAWNAIPSTTTPYYQVEGLDATTNTALPTYITTNTFITYTALTAGHNYEFTVSASFCPDGPFEIKSTPVYIPIPIIIIENIIEFQSPCTPGSPHSTADGASFSFCVEPSSTTGPFNNGIIGAINGYQFAIAYYNYELVVGDHSSNHQNYYFDDVSPSEVICYYQTGGTTIELFSVSHVGGTVTLPYISIKFLTNCGNFSSCGSPCSFQPERSNNNSIATAPAALSDAGVVTPNPFSSASIFRYTLDEDAPVMVGLYDATGRLLQQLEHTPLQKKGRYELLIDGEKLVRGTYFLQTSIGQHRKSYTLVKIE